MVTKLKLWAKRRRPGKVVVGVGALQGLTGLGSGLRWSRKMWTLKSLRFAPGTPTWISGVVDGKEG